MTVEAKKDAGALIVTVHNEGPPRPSELQDKLFDAFRRGHRDSRTAETAGLGLDPSISEEVVVAHGGSFEVSSAPDDGTTYRVSLPSILGEADSSQ